MLRRESPRRLLKALVPCACRHRILGKLRFTTKSINMGSLGILLVSIKIKIKIKILGQAMADLAPAVVDDPTDDDMATVVSI